MTNLRSGETRTNRGLHVTSRGWGGGLMVYVPGVSKERVEREKKEVSVSVLVYSLVSALWNLWPGCPFALAQGARRLGFRGGDSVLGSPAQRRGGDPSYIILPPSLLSSSPRRPPSHSQLKDQRCQVRKGFGCFILFGSRGLGRFLRGAASFVGPKHLSGSPPFPDSSPLTP